jgi:hypothetical protein
MKATKMPHRTGVVVAEDDMQVGEHYCVLGQKSGSSEPMQISGMAFRLLAMNLPFIVGKLVYDPDLTPLTFDARYVTFMRVTDDFVKAQRPNADQEKAS